MNLFQEQSPTLSAEDRKVAYVESFVTLEALIFDWNAELREIAFDVLDGGEVQRELFAAAAAAHEEFEDGRAEAEALPIEAFEQIQVSNGSLFTGTEKAKAVVFAAIGRLWSERELVDDNCGRRPPVTINLEPG